MFKPSVAYDRYADVKHKIDAFQDNGSYPLVLFPTSFTSQFEYGVSYLELLAYCREVKGNLPCLYDLREPKKPFEPKREVIPSSHSEYVLESFWQSYNFHLIKIWAIVAFLCGVLPGYTLWGLRGALLLLLGWTPMLVLTLIREGEKRKEIRVEIPFSEEELAEIKLKEENNYASRLEWYSNSVRQYEEDLKKYYELCDEQEQIMTSLLPSFIVSFLHSCFSKSEDYSVIDEPPKKGRSEDKLFASLMRRIPDSVHVDTVIAGYYPDIMVSTHNGVYFDIEIDEPYEMDSKREIHYIGSDDEVRNSRITDKGWLVIRFSEKQIMTECDKCVRIIENLKEIVEKGSIQALDETLSLRCLIMDKRWRKEDARMMALENYRKSF